MREAVGDNEDLHLELVQSVNNSGDPQEALYWANAYGIPKHKQPYNVQPLQEKASCRSVYHTCFVSFQQCVGDVAVSETLRALRFYAVFLLFKLIFMFLLTL